MTDFVWPDDLVPYAVSFYLQPNTGGSESPFSRRTKTYGLSAPRWVCSMSFRGGYWGTDNLESVGPRLDALIAKLKGRQNGVELYDFRRPALRITPGSTPGNLAAAIGDTLLTITGLPPGETVYAGDYIGGDGRPHIITDNAVASSGGQATVSFEPPLQAAIAADGAVLGNPTGTFRLISDDAGQNGVAVGEGVNMTLDFVEISPTALSAYGMSADAPGAVWDLSDWESVLFQDAAATTPVTAAGQSVGCVKNALGDSSWDLIQATSGSRPTFQIADGVPYITGTAKGMHTRAVHDVSMPLWMVAALQREEEAGYSRFGLFSRPLSHAFLAHDFKSTAIYNDFGSPLYSNTPFYSGAPKGFGVFDSVLSGGINSTRLNNGGEEAPRSPKAIPAMPDGYTAPTAIFGVNVGGQAATGAASATLNADNFVWYGGAALMMAPTESQRETLVSYFRRQIEPEMRATDKIILIDADSTMDDINNATTEWGGGAIYRWATETGPTYASAQVLRDANPTKTIYYRGWSSRGQQWGAWVRAQIGSSGDRIFVENASVSGSQPSYHMADRFDRVFGIHPHIDEIIWGHAHNMVADYAAVTGANAKYLRAGEFMDSMDKVRAEYPEAAHFLVSPHPIMQTGNDGTKAAKEALDYVATLYGDTFTADVYAPWLAARPQPTWTDDFVHPSMPTGVTEQLKIIVPRYNAWQSAKPGTIAPPLLGSSVTAINSNPLFSNFANPVPDNWAKTGAGTVAKSTAQIDADDGDSYSVKLSGVVYLEQVISAVAYRGAPVTVAVRQYMEAGGSANVGTINMVADGTGSWSIGNGAYSPSNKPTGAWRWMYHTVFVPSDANNITLRLNGTASGTGDAYCGRAVLVAGGLPKDLS